MPGIQRPTRALIHGTVHTLRRRHDIAGNHIEADIMAVLDERRPELWRMYSRPRQERDRLYKPQIVHPEGSKHACEEVCGSQTADLVLRPEREEGEDKVAIHYGIIASAHKPMKDSWARDDLARECGLMCFETEAAGLVKRFPCLVVRGICDYSDSHKNEEWQGYAAITAAAYSKDLLRSMVPSRVEQEIRLRDLLYPGK
jgi:hypothetical protein